MQDADNQMKKYQGHGDRTQRDSLHVIATANPSDLGGAISRWKEVATKAEDLETQIRDRLNTLVTSGGWEGSGAETYKQALTDEVLGRLQKIRASATAMATELQNVQHPTEQAVTAAENNPIPWDVETSWKIAQKKLGFLTWFGNQVGTVLGINDEKTLKSYNDAQADQGYEVVNGSGKVQQSITKPVWETTKTQTKPLAAVYHGKVTPEVNQFDVWMEHLGLNASQHKAVATAVDKVERMLGGFLTKPSVATDPQHDSPVQGHSLGEGSGGGQPAQPVATPIKAAGVDPSRYSADGYTPPAPQGTAAAGGAAAPPASAGIGGVGAPASAAVLGGSLGAGLAGAVPPRTNSLLTPPPTNAPAVIGMPGIGAAQVSPTVAPGMPGTSSGLGVPPVAGVPAGVGGYGGMGVGGGGIGGAGTAGRGLGSLPLGGGLRGGVGNPSFQMGATGRGLAGKGLVGGVESNRPYATLADAQRGSAGGSATAGAGGGMPMMGNRAHKKEEQREGTGEETWLEEDQDVWGTGDPDVDGITTH